LDIATAYITINNVQCFDNGDGIMTADAVGKDYITVNNSQIYNNAGDGIKVYLTKYFTINNTHIYNNSGNGINFYGSSNTSGILNNVWSYNNGNL